MLCFSRCFLFNVETVRHFNTVNTLDTVEPGYTWTRHVSTNTLDMVEPGYKRTQRVSTNTLDTVKSGICRPNKCPEPVQSRTGSCLRQQGDFLAKRPLKKHLYQHGHTLEEMESIP